MGQWLHGSVVELLWQPATLWGGACLHWKTKHLLSKVSVAEQSWVEPVPGEGKGAVYNSIQAKVALYRSTLRLSQLWKHLFLNKPVHRILHPCSYLILFVGHFKDVQWSFKCLCNTVFVYFLTINVIFMNLCFRWWDLLAFTQETATDFLTVFLFSFVLSFFLYHLAFASSCSSLHPLRCFL